MKRDFFQNSIVTENKMKTFNKKLEIPLTLIEANAFSSKFLNCQSMYKSYFERGKKLTSTKKSDYFSKKKKKKGHDLPEVSSKEMVNVF